MMGQADLVSWSAGDQIRRTSELAVRALGAALSPPFAPRRASSWTTAPCTASSSSQSSAVTSAPQSARGWKRGCWRLRRYVTGPWTRTVRVPDLGSSMTDQLVVESLPRAAAPLKRWIDPAFEGSYGLL